MARILGKRSFAVFFCVTLLVVAILASVNVASRFALKQYVQDQLQRVSWDISAYQTGDVQATREVAAALSRVSGITESSQLLFLRNSMTTEDIAYIDDRPIRMPWLSLLTTSDASILPINIRPLDDKAVLVLVGTKSQMGNAYAELQNRRRFEIKIAGHASPGAHQHEESPGQNGHAGTPVDVFGIGLERTIRIERKDLNRWFLEQTSSPSLIPEVGAILVTPYDQEIIGAFDALARGIVTVHEDGDIHEEAGSYFPDIIHLLEADTDRLVSGWDIDGSLRRLEALQTQLNAGTFAIGPRVFIDNTTRILLERMNRTANQVGLISLLVALPLIWVGWILMANLSTLLLLNERRKFGLMRLRGASGRQMGRALQLSIGLGALLGGASGVVFGTLLPIWFYEGELLPLELILIVQQPYILATFILIGVVIALTVSRKLVAYASTISPLEASGRVLQSEAARSEVKFGWAGAIALLLGSYKILAWISGFSITGVTEARWLLNVDRLLDFAGFPLFLYGFVTFLVSRRAFLSSALQSIITVTGGALRHLTVKHISTRPRRAAGFLLIVAMMTTIGLYPTVMTAVFDEKIERGTQIQIGSDIQLTLNASDIVSNRLLAAGGVGEQFRALRENVPQITRLLEAVEGVRDVTWTLFDGVSDGVYIPGYGFNGLPIYFLPDTASYLEAVHHEASLAQDGRFAELIGRMPGGDVVLSPAVSSFTERESGDTTLLGRDTSGRNMVEATVAGAVWYLPGSPAVSITDRESFDAARIDYVNYLFSNNAYLVADPGVAAIGDLDVLITRVQIAVDIAPGADPQTVYGRIIDTLPIEPAGIRTYEEELGKVGSDMYIFLARENVQIYLIGGIFLAVIGILSVAYTNYVEDRRTLGLLRIRGAGPEHMLRFFGSGILAPSFIGLLIGVIVSLVVGYGITNLVWKLRDVKNILLYLETHIAVSALTVAITLGLLLLIAFIGVVFSQWAFRKTVREGLGES